MTYKLRDATLCFLISKENGKINKICLAMKKRGFGTGKWNGVGGKVEDKETIEEATIREAKEEIGIIISKLEKIATLTFLFPHNPLWNQLVHVYWSDQWEGEPQESEEMRPDWFSIDKLPYENMWSADHIWLSHVLEGNKVVATFSFGQKDEVLSHELNLVSAHEL